MTTLLQTALAAHRQTIIKQQEFYRAMVAKEQAQGQAIAQAVAKRVLKVDVPDDAILVQIIDSATEPSLGKICFDFETEIGPMTFKVLTYASKRDETGSYDKNHSWLEVSVSQCPPRSINSLGDLGEYVATVVLPRIGMEELPHD